MAKVKMTGLILPHDGRWSDEYVWQVPDILTDAGGIDLDFISWCRKHFTGEYRFEDLGDGRWNLRFLSEDDYILMMMKHDESPASK